MEEIEMLAGADINIELCFAAAPLSAAPSTTISAPLAPPEPPNIRTAAAAAAAPSF